MSAFDPGFGGGVPPRPAPNVPAMTSARQGTGIADSAAAQRALWAQANGITPGAPLNDFGRMIMNQFQQQVRPWLGAMLAAGNPLTSVGDLIGQFAQQAQGGAQDFNNFLSGSTNAFLSNPTLVNTIARAGTDAQGAAQLASIIGLGQAPFDPVFGQIARDQFQEGFGQYQLGNINAGAPNATGGGMVDFLRSDPRFSWMLGG